MTTGFVTCIKTGSKIYILNYIVSLNRYRSLVNIIVSIIDFIIELNRLMKDQLPKLYEHFEKTGVETHMFASQWFLTLFTARFPLCFVFHTLDVCKYRS